MNNSKAYVPASMVTGAGWKARITRAQAKVDKARDPQNLLVRRIRQYSANMDGAEKRARDEYEIEHAPVSSSIPPTVHPQVYDLLMRFLDENGLVSRDLSLPLRETGEALDAKIQRYRAEAEAEHQRAVADLNATERDNALAKVRDAQAALQAIETRGTVPGEVVAVDASGTSADIEAPKRRGRPPRVNLDPKAGDDALPVA